MKHLTALVMTVAVVGLIFTCPAQAQEERISDAKADIDLVICLDSSGSMNGLIDSARQKLWDIVNELLNVTPQPNLRVALLSYGGDAAPENGHVILQIDLTHDLDTFYEKLMALNAKGSVELVGRVLNEALEELDWSENDDALRIIFVAGNETADQGREEHDYREICKNAVDADVFVNAIFCGADTDPVVPGWRDVARLGNGDFTNINQNGVVVIETPMDAELTKLGTELNGTYIAYGAEGLVAKDKQKKQDDNASGQNSQVAASRAVCKGSSNYRNDHWDLVDACNNKKDFDLKKIKKEDLPENMREMTLGEQTEYIDNMYKQRCEVQDKIKKINVKRSAYIQEEMKKLNKDGQASLDEAIKGCLRRQAAAKNFRFKDEEEKPDPAK